MVTNVYGGNIVVNIANAPVLKNPGRLDTYQPALGDLVVLMRQDDNWTIIGAYINSVSDNLVVNGNFSDGFNVGGQGGGGLTNWGQVIISQAASHTLVQDARDADLTLAGEALTSRYLMAQQLTTTASGTTQTYAISDFVVVIPGQVYTASSFVRGTFDSGMTVSVYMGINWYTIGGTLDSLDSSNRVFLPISSWRKISVPGPFGAGATVPNTAAYARVMLRTDFRTDATDAVSRQALTMWNRAVLKRLG